MEFSTWLRAERQRHGIKAQTLALGTGLSPTKLSQIENDHSEATLPMAWVICKALEVSGEELLKVLLEEKYEGHRHEISPLRGNVVTHDMVVHFLSGLGENYQAGLTLLAELWWCAEEEWYYLENPDEISIPTGEIEAKKTLVQYFLSTKRYRLAEIPVEQSYDLDIGALQSIYHAEGILTFREIGAYLRLSRKRNNRSLVETAQSAHRSLAVLTRVETTGTPDVRLSDILFWDANFSHNNELFRMYWNAMVCPLTPVETSDGIPLFKAGTLFITLNRISQLRRKYSGGKWIARLQEKLDRLTQSTNEVQ